MHSHLTRLAPVARPTLKRLFVAAILVALAGTTFGQEAPKPAPTLVWSGKMNSGVTVLANGVDTAQVALWGDDAGVLGGRLSLIGKYSDGPFGLSFESRWDGLLTTATAGSAAPVYFKHAYLWASFFDKLVTAQVGIVKEESTKTAGDKGFKYATEAPGAVVVVNPVKELAVQAFVGASAGLQTASLANAIGTFADTISAVSAAYTIPSTLKLFAGSKWLNSKFNGYAPREFYAGAAILAVPNLVANLEYGYENLNSGKVEGKTTLVETVQYGFKGLGVAPLTVGLKSYQYLYDADVKTFSNAGTATEAQGPSLRVQPWASWTLDGGITPKLEAAFISGASVLAGDYDKYLGTGVLASLDPTKKNANNFALLELRPSVKVAMSPTQTLNFIYAYTASIGSNDVTFLSANKDARSLQNLQIDFVSSF